MKVVLSSCVAGFAVASSSPSTDVLAKFEEFRIKWGVSYMGAEYVERAKYFEDHLRKVEHLQEIEQGTATYTYLGPFADRSPEEMSKRFGASQSRVFAHFPEAPLLNISLGASLDWVAKGAVNPIKDQGQCGSCWAFSTACNLEGAGFVTTGKLVSVSEQNIVDCDHSDDGCNGGIPSSALTWSSRNGGVASEQAYPYTARDGSCRSSVAKIVQNTAYHSISTNEDQIAQALQTYGPLSIAVDANGFNGYHGGVLQNPSCSKTALNHAINIVGYGEDRVPYWKVRNSWGTNWGEAGYIRVYRGDCTCGVCQQVVTATGVTVSGTPTPPSPPTPPTPPSPTPPGPTPCKVCTWNSDCPSGEECYYPTQWANSGCCYSSPPSANRDEMSPEITTISDTSGNIVDDVMKLVCGLMKNGDNEVAAEKLICGNMNPLLVGVCNALVKADWEIFEKVGHCNAEGDSEVNDEIMKVSATSGNIADDIKKLVCGLMKNGDNEAAAETIICGHMNPLLVGVCKALVKADWDIFEKVGHCDAEGHFDVIV